MRLNFELPNIFAKLAPFSQPPKVMSEENRRADQLINRPRVQFHDPNSLHFADAMKPVIPGNGNITMGLCVIEVAQQAEWDRAATCQVGPLRLFFRSVLFDNRVKHL